MVTGESVHYVSSGGFIEPPTATDILYRKAHAPQAPKPTGLDWDAHTPSCASCEQKSGQIDATGLCPGCRGEAAAYGVQADVTRDGDTYQALDAADVTARFTAPTQTPQAADQAPATDIPAVVEPAFHAAPPAARPRPAAPSVRAKIRKVSPNDVVITICSTADPIDMLALSALLADLLATQSPATARRLSPVSGAVAGPKSEGRTRVGKPARPSGAPRKKRVDTFPVAEAQRLYLTELLTVPEIAGRLGFGVATVRRKLKTAGTPMRDDRAGHSGGHAKAYDPAMVDAVRRLYLDEQLTIAQVAERLYSTPKIIGRLMHRHDIAARPDAFTTEGHPRTDNASALKAQIAALGVTSRDIRAWALHQGLIERITRGIPSQTLVDAYQAAHNQQAS